MGAHLAPDVGAAAVEWERNLGRATFGAILAAAALVAARLAFGPGRLEVALLSVVLAVMVTARVAGFWASLVTTFVAAVLVDLGWLYPGSASPASRPLDVVALCLFGLVAILTGRAAAVSEASDRARGAPATSGTAAAPVTSGTAVAPVTSPAAVVPITSGAAVVHGASRATGSAVFAPPGEPLTAREVDVLSLLAAGLSNDEIAEHLVVSPNTVKTHLSHAYAKLGATSRTAAVARARAAGLVSAGAAVPGASLGAPGGDRPDRGALERAGR